MVAKKLAQFICIYDNEYKTGEQKILFFLGGGYRIFRVCFSPSPSCWGKQQQMLRAVRLRRVQNVER